MIHRRLSSPVCVFCLLAAIFFSSASAAEYCYLQPADQILTIGDSITAQGVYQSYMQQVLDTLYPGAGIKIVNRGVGGMKADGGVGVLNDYLKSAKPTVITVMFGVNDTGWADTDQDAKEKAYVEQMTKIIDIAQQNKIDIILLRETHFTHNNMTTPWEAQINTFLLRLLAAETRLAAEKRVPVINVHDAYRRALAAAWAKDLRYEFTPDVIHPTHPGQAAMAAEILRALGVGLPLADKTRGPLHLQQSIDVAVDVLDDLGVAPEHGAITVQIRCRNLTGHAINGRLVSAIGNDKNLEKVKLDPFGSQIVKVKMPVSSLPGRWAIVPAYAAFDSSTHSMLETLPPASVFTASHALFHYSKIVPAGTKPFSAAGADFRNASGGKQQCTVTDISVRREGELIKIDFKWIDEKVILAQPSFKGRLDLVIPTPLDLNARDGQPCDAVEFYLDLRPDASAGRFTSDIDSNPQGLLRVGVSKIEENGKTVATVQLPEGTPPASAKLTAAAANSYRLEVHAPATGSSVGFSMRVTDTDEFGLGKGRSFYLTGRPNVSFEPMSFVRLSVNSGMFYRVGY